MANYSILKAAIAQVIKTNGNNEITGNLLQQQLFSMVNTLGTGYQCMGVAVLTPTPTNPGTPDANVFYIASEPGTYANFGNIVINDGEVCLLTYNGTWSKRVTGAATASQLNQLGQEVEEYIGIPRETTLDFTQGEVSRNVYYKVNSGWKLSGSIENKSATSSTIYVTAHDADNTRIGRITFDNVAGGEIKNFTFVSETYDIEYITITISTRIVLDVVVSAEKSEQLRNELHSTAADIYKDMDRRTVAFVPVSANYTLAYDNLAIKNGDSFKLRINGSADWTRLIVSTDENGTNRIYDVSDTASSFARVLTANVNIDRLYICVVYTGTITLSSEILTNVAYSLSSAVEQQQTAINQLTPAVTKNTTDIAGIKDDLYKEIEEVPWDSSSDIVKDIILQTPIGKKVRITISNTGVVNDTTVSLKAKSNTPGILDVLMNAVVINKGSSYSIEYTSTFDVAIYQVECNAGRTTCNILFEEYVLDEITVLDDRVTKIESDIIPSDYIEDKTLDKDGVLHSSQNNYKVTPFLRLDGSNIVLEKTAYLNSGNSNIAIPCVFYDRDKNRLFFNSYYEPASEGVQDVTIPVSSIPESAAYIKCTLHKVNGKVISGVCNNIEDLQLIADEGFSLGKCRDYIIKDLAYHPLGELTKGYLCITGDDGTYPLMTYTLPMILQKDIKFTVVIGSGAEILIDNTYKDNFVNIVTSEGSKIAVAQHGYVQWTKYSESELYDFFMQEKAYFNALGIEVKGAGQPQVYTSYMIEAMAGGLYDVVRGAWTTYDGQGNPNYHSLYEWRPPVSSPRSNLYCLPSCNIRDYTLAQWKEIIDYAVTNKRLVNIYMHDFDFVERYPEDTSKPAIHTATAEEVAARKALLEGVIDYAKSVNIEIVSLGDVARLT